MKIAYIARLGLSVLAAGAVGLPPTCWAEGAREIQVAGRTLGFLQNAPTGRVVMGIVYDPSKPGSVAEKDEIITAIGAGMNAGSATVVGRPIDASAVSSAGDVYALYLTHGVNYSAVSAAAKAKKILTISADMACVTSGACVMGVEADPKVGITVNQAAAASIGATFKAAFKMMIKEI